MKLYVLFFVGLFFVLVSCQKNEKDKNFLISKNQIGLLTKDTHVSQLDSVFVGDSVVNKNTSKRFSESNEIVVYDKEGQELLRLQPAKKFDSSSTITNVEIMDTIYKTAKGLGKGSPFKVLKTNYTISRIENILGAAVIFIDELNAYVVIDKKDILEPTQMGAKIKTNQIKNEARIKHFWLGWE